MARIRKTKAAQVEERDMNTIATMADVQAIEAKLVGMVKKFTVEFEALIRDIRETIEGSRP